MNSKTLFLSALALTASVSAKPLTYPECGKWNFSVNLENGIESQTSLLPVDGQLHLSSTSTFYQISTRQSVGYGKWFYFQNRLSYSRGFCTVEGGNLAAKNNIFDGEWSVFCPLRIPSRFRLTLGPQIGFSLRQNKSEFFGPETHEG